MRMVPSHRLIQALAAVLALSGTSAQACSHAEVCGDVATSFSGEVEIENIVLTWNTDSEDASVQSYRLSRYDCSNPAACTTLVATIQRVGACGQEEDYSYIDTPPAPMTSWTYILEVVRTGSTLACAIHHDPQ